MCWAELEKNGRNGKRQRAADNDGSEVQGQDILRVRVPAAFTSTTIMHTHAHSHTPRVHAHTYSEPAICLGRLAHVTFVFGGLQTDGKCRWGMKTHFSPWTLTPV